MAAWREDEDLEEVLLQRYCAGTASAEEAVRIETWFREHPGQREWYEQLKMVLRKREFLVMSAEERNAVLAEFIHEALARRPGGLLEVPRRKARHDERSFSGQPLRRGIWYVTAGLLIGVLGVIIGRGGRMNHLFGSTARQVSTYTTANGERANITLPDGNTVALDVASRLDVPTDYLAGDHTLHLSGEALFTVQHHAGMPFTIIAGQTAARVLGTNFLMRHYAADSVTTVAVREGRVAVGRAIVTANRLIELQHNGTGKQLVADPALFSFATGTLTLSDLFLPEAIPELDRWYDADIRLGDPSLATRGIGGKFAAGSLGELEKILQMTLDVRVVRAGRVLTLFPKS